MAYFIKLKNPPIREIIFTISFNENVPVEKLDVFKGLPEIAKTFTVIDKGFNTEVVAKNNEQPISKTTLDGYLLRSPATFSRIIQARKGSFALHKVNGYEEFEILIKEFFKYWDLLVQCTGTLTVNNISVRYLNFIEKSSNETTNDLITIVTNHPYGDAIDNNFTQYKFKYDKAPEIEATIIIAKGKNGNSDGMVLDIILNKKINNSPNREFILNSFADMKAAKNDLFFRSITETTIKKYNQ